MTKISDIFGKTQNVLYIRSYVELIYDGFAC